MDTVRVLRVLEYVGPRDEVERVVAMSIQGERTYFHDGRAMTIKAATIGNYPEILGAAGPDDGQ